MNGEASAESAKDRDIQTRQEPEGKAPSRMNNPQHRGITVVGGSGFIGTRLCSRLAEAHESFTIIDKKESAAYPNRTKLADVRELERLKQVLPSGSPIIHLAAEHSDNVRPISLYDEVNVGGAENICDAARWKNVDTIIFTSSVAVYGFTSGADESGMINPFGDYGRTKAEAEEVFRRWQKEDEERRTMVIIRPAVVFGERNRGNVYNLLRQVASGRFIMVGSGKNIKSMAYVENVAAFLHHSLAFGPGIHLYNYVDKPDFDMNTLVGTVCQTLNAKANTEIRIPFWVGVGMGKLIDVIALIARRKFAISSIRIKKFCANSKYEASVASTGFAPPVSILEGLQKTLHYEFLEQHNEDCFYTE